MIRSRLRESIAKDKTVLYEPMDDESDDCPLHENPIPNVIF
jgi:hypothetical protein